MANQLVRQHGAVHHMAEDILPRMAAGTIKDIARVTDIVAAEVEETLAAEEDVEIEDGPPIKPTSN